MVTAEQVWEALGEIPDPEIPVISLVDLGVIRDVAVDGAYVRVELTPTVLGCPALEAMRRALEATVTELGGGELVERARVADLVLRDRRERDVLLERRRDARPLRVPPADDQLVVSQAQKQLCPLVHVPPSGAP